MSLELFVDLVINATDWCAETRIVKTIRSPTKETRQTRMTKVQREDQNLIDTLYFEGDEIMEKLGMTRYEDGQWSEADLQWVWDMAKKHSVHWLREKGPAAFASGSASI